MSIFTILILGFIIWINHRAWEFHKVGNYDQAAINFGMLIFFLWAAIGSSFGPMQVGEDQTITAPIGIYFGAVYIMGVLSAVFMVWLEWRGHKSTSYTWMFVTFILLSLAGVIRFIELLNSLPSSPGG